MVQWYHQNRGRPPFNWTERDGKDMQHFNRKDLTNEWGNAIDERFVISQESADECPIFVDYLHNDVDGKVVYDRASGEFYYDDDVELVGVFIDDDDDDEYFCFKRKEKEK